MVQKHPDSLVMPLPEWVVDFDVQKNAEEHFDRIAAEVKSGKKGTIEELSLPAGGDYTWMNLRDEAEDEKAAAVQQVGQVVLPLVVVATQ